MFVAALALYGVGVLAAFSPCSVPLYPALLATWTAGGTRRWMTVAAFVAGAVATFVAVGSAGAAVGGLVGGTRWLVRAAGVWLMILAVRAVWRPERTGVLAPWLAGRAARLTSRVPGDGATRDGPARRGDAGRDGRGVPGSFFVGVGAGVAWSPCAGPLLGTALTAAAVSASPTRAAVLLAAYGLGTCTPLIAVLLGAVRLAHLRRAVPRLHRVGRFAGLVVVFGVGASMAADRYGSLAGWLPTGV
ncbi:MAG: cytochrome c biogenesis protein CcdA [Ilumatobacteraceae bacterium]